MNRNFCEVAKTFYKTGGIALVGKVDAKTTRYFHEEASPHYIFAISDTEVDLENGNPNDGITIQIVMSDIQKETNEFIRILDQSTVSLVLADDIIKQGIHWESTIRLVSKLIRDGGTAIFRINNRTYKETFKHTPDYIMSIESIEAIIRAHFDRVSMYYALYTRKKFHMYDSLSDTNSNSAIFVCYNYGVGI